MRSGMSSGKEFSSFRISGIEKKDLPGPSGISKSLTLFSLRRNRKRRKYERPGMRPHNWNRKIDHIFSAKKARHTFSSGTRLKLSERADIYHLLWKTDFYGKDSRKELDLPHLSSLSLNEPLRGKEASGRIARVLSLARARKREKSP